MEFKEFKDKTPREIKAFIASCDEEIIHLEAKLREKENSMDMQHKTRRQQSKRISFLRAKIAEYNVFVEAYEKLESTLLQDQSDCENKLEILKLNMITLTVSSFLLLKLIQIFKNEIVQQEDKVKNHAY